MRILVCGGRDYNDKATMYSILDEYGDLGDDITIIEGGANGADTLAEHVAVTNWWKSETYPADWKTYGRAAGPIRNQRMLDEGKPDIVIAFPGGRGTEDMVRRAEKAGVSVRRVK